ncbi:MAG: hypothetical protein U0232_14275 [Thermomicrobiales bacterium]
MTVTVGVTTNADGDGDAMAELADAPPARCGAVVGVAVGAVGAPQATSAVMVARAIMIRIHRERCMANLHSKLQRQ